MTECFFKVLRPGINTTYQDEGRFSLQHLGLPPSGCMDSQAFSLVNAIVGNKKNTGVIEFAYQGPLLQLIKGKTKFAITGNVNFKIINFLRIFYELAKKNPCQIATIQNTRLRKNNSLLRDITLTSLICL